MATGAPAGCDASESDCSPKMCSIGHPNVLALLHQYCSIAYTATVPSDPRQRGIKKGGRRRTGKLNQLRGQLTRASPGGPTQSCSECANVDRQFNGLWSKLFTNVPQYISRSPKGKSTGHKRWCVFHSENEVFVSYTKQYFTVTEFNSLDPDTMVNIRFYNDFRTNITSWRAATTPRSSLAIESQHQRHYRVQLMKSLERKEQWLKLHAVPDDQMKLQQAPKATPKEPKSCAGSYEGPTSSCHKCNGFISCRCTGIYCPKCNHQMYNTSLSQWDQEAREEYDWIVHKHSIDCDICQHLTTINAQGAYKCSGGCYIHINRSKYVHFDTST